MYQLLITYIKYQSYISAAVDISAANDTVVEAFLLLTSSCVAAEELIEDG